VTTESRSIQVASITHIHGLLNKIPFTVLVIFVLTLGLAPFSPEPHLWEKMKMLTSGSLTRPVDGFDMLLQGLPRILLALKLAVSRLDPQSSD